MDEAVSETAARAVVPEDAVAVAGEQERNGNVRVVLREVDGFAAIVPDAGLVLAETVKRFLRIPHVDETLRVIGFFAVDFGWCQRSRVFLREFVTSGVIENDRTVGASDFDFEARSGEGDEFGVVGVESEVGFGPLFFSDEKVGVLRDVALDGVHDMNDGVRADLESQESGLENHEGAIGLHADGLNGVEGYPLGEQGGGNGSQKKKEQEGSNVLVRTQKGNWSHEYYRTPCTITLI